MEAQITNAIIYAPLDFFKGFFIGFFVSLIFCVLSFWALMRFMCKNTNKNTENLQSQNENLQSHFKGEFERLRQENENRRSYYEAEFLRLQKERQEMANEFLKTLHGVLRGDLKIQI